SRRIDFLRTHLPFTSKSRYQNFQHHYLYDCSASRCTPSNAVNSVPDMDVVFQPKYNHGYSWYLNNGIAVKGYAWNEAGELLQEQKLAAVFNEITTRDSLETLLRSLNGLFVVAGTKKDRVFIAADRTRSFPL